MAKFNLSDNPKNMKTTQVEVATKTSISEKIGVLVIMLAALSMAAGLVLGMISKSEPKEALTETMSVTYNFSEPEIIKMEDFDRINIPNLDNYGEPGSPSLPYKSVNILIPQEKKVVDVNVILKGKTQLAGKYLIEPGQQVYPTFFNENEDIQDTPPDYNIYNSAKIYPIKNNIGRSIQHFRGYTIFQINLIPVQYIPKSRDLFFFSEVEVVLSLQIEDSRQAHPFFRNEVKDETQLKSKVDNIEKVNTYTKEGTAITSSLPFHSVHSYVIITNETLGDSWQSLIVSKTAKGLNPAVVTTEYIYNNYSGIDNQEKVRNFIIDAYANWQTEYVLLGGDVEIVPIRRARSQVGQYVDNIPTDLYYAALDGNWNADGDDYWGEYEDDVDFIAEVYVGRAPVNTVDEINNFLNKTLSFESSLLQDYHALFIGQELDYSGENWGGDRKDDGIPFYPSEYGITTLYDRDETFSRSAVINNIDNNDYQIINHSDHAMYTWVMGLYINDVLGLTNDQYFLGYSTGCHSAALDYSDSIGEEFVKSNSGAYAYIGNSRYGFWCPGDCRSTSDIADERFFRFIFFDGERKLGQAFQLSKETLWSQMPSARWIYYSLNLLGDPEIDVIGPTVAGKITSPLSNDSINGVVDIKGTANGGSLDSYILEYSPVSDSPQWQIIGTYSNPIANETIMQWDTLQINDGDYYLRLTVNDSVGNNFIDQIIVTVNNSYISSPVSHAVFSLFGPDINISGNAVGSSFESYSIDYGFGEEPNEWFNNGITLTGGGSSPIQNDVLALWDTSNLTEGGYYTIRLIVNYAQGETDIEKKLIYIENQYQDSWPVEASTFLNGSPVVSDIDTDGDNELIAVAGYTDSMIYAWQHNDNDGDGQADLVTGWPVQTGLWVESTPSIGDVNNDGFLEVVVSGGNGVEIWGHDGNQIAFWYQDLDNDQNYFGDGTILEDINGDGYLEIIAASQLMSGKMAIYIWDYQGNVINGWPKIMLENSQNYGGLPAVGDIDNDGNKEIVYVNREKVYVWRSNSTIVTGWPITAHTGNSTPSLADLDKDGNLEIIVITTRWVNQDIITELYVWHYNGQVMNGWPQIVPYGAFGFALVSDIDNNNDLEIVIGGRDYLYAYNHDGGMISGWPVYVEGYYMPSVIADIDSDSDLEIVTVRPRVFNGEYYINIIHHDGSIVAGWPRPITGGVWDSVPTFSDFDNDGDIELAVFSNLNSWPNSEHKIYMWDLTGSYPAPNQGWQQLAYDSKHTSLYSRCSDNIIFGECDSAGLFCDNGNLHHVCNECGYTCICGDGEVNGDEICERDQIQVCTTEDGYIGSQACTETCDAWGVCTTTEFCGDGQVNGPEVCEIPQFQACQNSQGKSGFQDCNASCDWDTCYICGDINNDSMLVGLDVTYFTDWSRGLNSGPNPVWKADVNNDQIVNVSDIDYLVSYFKSGPAPSCLHDATLAQAICGDANSDLRVNGNDVTFITNYVKSGNPPFFPMWKADVNRDYQVTSADATYLINYLKGGPALNCPGF